MKWHEKKVIEIISKINKKVIYVLIILSFSYFLSQLYNCMYTCKALCLTTIFKENVFVNCISLPYTIGITRGYEMNWRLVWHINFTSETGILIKRECKCKNVCIISSLFNFNRCSFVLLQFYILGGLQW